MLLSLDSTLEQPGKPSATRGPSVQLGLRPRGRMVLWWLCQGSTWLGGLHFPELPVLKAAHWGGLQGTFLGDLEDGEKQQPLHVLSRSCQLGLPRLHLPGSPLSSTPNQVYVFNSMVKSPGFHRMSMPSRSKAANSDRFGSILRRFHMAPVSLTLHPFPLPACPPCGLHT